MNVVLIPFFLAANVLVNDTSNWKFGPEYSYNLSITYDLRQNIIDKNVINASINSTVQCRPKTREILLCRLNNGSITVNSINRTVMENVESEKLFGIKFDEYGVQAVLDESPPDDKWTVNTIRQIANQFSINANLIRENVRLMPLRSFKEERESTSMGDCMTSYVFKCEAHRPSAIQTETTNLQFQVLPIPNVKSRINLTISKNRIECVDVPERLDIHKAATFKMEKFTSTIRIDDTFRTFTEINGYMNASSRKFPELEFLLFKQTIELNLDTIKAAQTKLPSFDGQLIKLNTKFPPK